MLPIEIKVSTAIKLRRLTKNDSPVIFDAIINNRPHLRKWLPFIDNTKNPQDTMAFVDSVIDNNDRTQEIFTIWLNSQFCGLVGLKDIDYINQKVELGYWLIEQMTGKGIVTRSIEKIMKLCFIELELNRIQIKCGVGNFKSSAIPKRLGFKFEGIERAGERHLNGYVDLEIYSLLKKEWQ